MGQNREDWIQSNRRLAASPFGTFPSTTPPVPTSPPSISRSSVWWGNLEPWMDEEYVRQVCTLMRWDPIKIRVPPPSTDAPHANNPGHCFLTFQSPSHAASVLAQVSSGNVQMPNSSRSFLLNWAANIPSPATPIPPYSPSPANPPGQASHQQYPKEYSIFVGDLAPETSNSDLVAVFRNPVLGLRNDREPKFIRPFLSCKSAKIMLDPVTGVSRGYGFVRFTDESDQQRALIEMHGLYCLSRPMRISPATAKHKTNPGSTAFDVPHMPFSHQPVHGGSTPQHLAAAAAAQANANSVSGPIASTSSNSVPSSNSSSSLSAGSQSVNSINSSATSQSSGPPTSPPSFMFNNPEELLHLPNNVLAQIAQQYATNGPATSQKPPSGVSITAPCSHDSPPQGQVPNGSSRYMINEESWKHHAQARAILGNLIGPNGEQLTSADPYNTTVFVGGLSPLISEETLRTFFTPFGDIHYVKVPVGKHCGFVQFVRKADAELAIDKMQGFPIGGSRIRLSWGRSQYKAAQAAAQAAQNAALQSHFAGNGGGPSFPSQGMPAGVDQPVGLNAGPPPVTQEQAMQLLQKLSLQGYFGAPANHPANGGPDGYQTAALPNGIHHNGAGPYRSDTMRSSLPADDGNGPYEHLGGGFDYRHASHPSFAEAGPQRGGQLAPKLLDRPSSHLSSFAPFSPDPATLNIPQTANYPAQGMLSPGFSSSPPHSAHSKRRDSAALFPSQEYHNNAQYYPSAIDTAPSHEHGNMSGSQASVSPSTSTGTTRPSSSAPASRYGHFLDGSPYTGGMINKHTSGTGAQPISRPPSGQRPKPETGVHQVDGEHNLIQDLNGTLASLNLNLESASQYSEDTSRKEAMNGATDVSIGSDPSAGH